MMIHSKLHEIYQFGDRPFYFVGDFVDYYGQCFVATLDTTSKQFREDAWVAVDDPDKCITLSFLGKVDTIILEDRNNIWRYDHLQSTMPTISFHEKPHGPAGDWCMYR